MAGFEVRERRAGSGTRSYDRCSRGLAHSRAVAAVVAGAAVESPPFGGRASASSPAALGNTSRVDLLVVAGGDGLGPTLELDRGVEGVFPQLVSGPGRCASGVRRIRIANGHAGCMVARI